MDYFRITSVFCLETHPVLPGIVFYLIFNFNFPDSIIDFYLFNLPMWSCEFWEKGHDVDYFNKNCFYCVKWKSFNFEFRLCCQELPKKGWKYLTIPLNAVKHRYFMVSTNGEYFVKLSRILTFASVFLYFDVAQYFHIWRQTMQGQLSLGSLFSALLNLGWASPI